MTPDWKKRLAQVLKELGLVGDEYTGKFIINMNQGNITDCERTERLK